jgi:hypothetical protein
MGRVGSSSKMTKYLWTGESEYCICGHHVTDHEISQWLISLIGLPIVWVYYAYTGSSNTE